MSIKRKLTFMTMGISLAAVLLTVCAITTYLIYDMRKSKIESLAVTAAMAADRNAAALIFLDAARGRDNLDIFRLSPSVLMACIYNAQGALFADYRAQNPQAPQCPQSYGDTAPLPHLLTAFQDILKDNDTIGHVSLAESTDEIDAYVHKIVQISVIAILLMFGATLPATVYFQRAISGPILRLASAVQSITDHHDYARSSHGESYPDETGILARAFDEMLGEVRKRDRELKLANETLEEKVIARTRELEEARRKAEAASEAKSEFLRNMSHEFRTPLHALINFSAYGVKEYETAGRSKLRQYFELIQNGSARLGRLVNEVLDLARLEHGTNLFNFARADLRELVTRATDQMHPLLEEKKITFHLDQELFPLTAHCDHDKIIQVITNILSNAVKFAPLSSRITLSSHKVQDRLMVSLSDEGPGIPEAEKEAIFESFRQSSRTNTGAGGTGLGLAICRNILKSHDGAIWAENNLHGTGACVTFTLPAAQEEKLPELTMKPPEIPYDLRAQTYHPRAG